MISNLSILCHHSLLVTELIAHVNINHVEIWLRLIGQVGHLLLDIAYVHVANELPIRKSVRWSIDHVDVCATVFCLFQLTTWLSHLMIVLGHEFLKFLAERYRDVAIDLLVILFISVKLQWAVIVVIESIFNFP